MTELRRANVFGVLRLARVTFARRSIVSVGGMSFDKSIPWTESASFAIGPPLSSFGS